MYSANAFDEWEYAGLLDDRVAEFPWKAIPRSKKNLDRWLFLSVVRGKRPLINDGYLILNDSCMRSLRDRYSPLSVLLRRGYAGILARHTPVSLMALATSGAEEGIASYRKLTADRARWRGVSETLRSVDAELLPGSQRIEWPNFSLSLSFQRLVERLAARTPAELGLRFVSQLIWDRLTGAVLDESAARPRDGWQQATERYARSHRQVVELMQLGNELYHYNFGIALSAKPPRRIGKRFSIQTRLSPGLAGFTALQTATPTRPTSFEHQITIPKGVPYDDGELLVPLLDPIEPVGRSRVEYLREYAAFVAGDSDEQAMGEATQAYQHELDTFLERRARCYVASRVCHATVCTVTAASAGASAMLAWGIPEGATLALVTFVGTDYLVPIVTERWHVNADIEQMLRPVTSAMGKVGRMLHGRRAITSFSIDPAEARRLVKGLSPSGQRA